MPELPEVETICRGIAPVAEQQIITDVIVREQRLRWPIPDDFGYQVIGKTIDQVTRRGKYLLMTLSPAPTDILIHLGMSGSLQVVALEQPLKKHDHVDIILSSGYCLRYHDPRRFGAMLWTADSSNHALLAVLGPEPLSAAFNKNYLFKKIYKRTSPIKSLIMDSHLVVGIGNIYANEALFIAGIHPQRAGNTLSLEECGNLVAASKQVLKRAIKQGGTTLKDFIDSKGKPGYFAQALQVYGREGEGCYHCGTLISVIRITQRSTYFCVRCQPSA